MAWQVELATAFFPIVPTLGHLLEPSGVLPGEARASERGDRSQSSVILANRRRKCNDTFYPLGI